MDPTRSKELWINPRSRHAAFARRCLQSLQLKGEQHCFSYRIPVLIRKIENVKMIWFGYYNTPYHFQNAEMTPELRDDLINFSFDNLQDVFENCQIWSPDRTYSVLTFLPLFLIALKKLVCYGSPLMCSLHTYEFYEIATARSGSHLADSSIEFDRMLCNVLEKYHSFPGFALLLGSLLRGANTGGAYILLGIIVSSYLARQRGRGIFSTRQGFLKSQDSILTPLWSKGAL